MFKIWGKDGFLNKDELLSMLEKMNITNPFSLVSEAEKKGCVNIGRTKILVFK
jgi:hypothetical protein